MLVRSQTVGSVFKSKLPAPRPLRAARTMASALPERFELKGKTIAVTGTSRGLGLEFVKQLLAKGNKVVAAARNPDASPGLQQLKSKHQEELTLTKLDVDSPESIAAWGAELRKSFPSVDVVINNAGILKGREELEDVTSEDLVAHYVTNCVGPILVVQTLLKNKLLPPGSLIANLTSLVGSITENEGGGLYAYRCSKIAANMATKSMSIDLAPRGITSTILHPGYVRTDMTKGQGYIDVDESVRGMIAVLESGKPLNGEWYHTTGRHLPWEAYIDVGESVRRMIFVLEGGKQLNGEWYHTTGRHLPG